VAHAGASIGIKNTNLAFAPSVLFLRQGPLSEINVGGLIRYTLREEARESGRATVSEVREIMGFSPR